MTIGLGIGLGLSFGSQGAGAVADLPMSPLQTPTLIESANALDGSPSGGAAVTLDSTNKVQGTGAWLVEGSGVSGQNPIYTKTASLVDDMSTWDVIAWWEHHKGYPHASQTFWQFGRSGSYNTGQPAFSQVNGNYGKGIWRAANVSEFTGSPAGSGQIDRRFRITQNAPYNNRVDVDCLMKNAGGYPTVLFTFDDNEDTTIDVAYPLMAAYGMKGSCYIAPTGASGIGVSDSMTLAELQTLYAAGWDMACDGTTDDTAMTAQASVAAAITNINGVRTYLTSNGMSRAADHLCYPNGYFQGDSGGVIPTATQVAAVTAPGGTTLNFGAASNVQNGWAVYGKGIPLGTTVISGGGASTSSVVVSNSISAQGPLAAAFIDESPTFYKPKLIDALAAASYRTGRTTLGGTFYSRFGFGDQALVLPGQGVSGLTLAQMTAFVDTAISRKSTLIFYFHRITAGGGGINIATADFQGLVDYVGAKKRLGQLAVLTLSELWTRDSNGAASLPTSPPVTQTLYDHATQTGMASTADTTDYTFGTGMVFAVDMMVSSVSIYHPVTTADPGRTVALYTTGTERLVSKTGAAETSGAGWKKVTFDTPYFVKAGNKIIPSVTVTVDNGYSFVTGGFNSAKTRGDITGLIKTDTDISPGNGRYAIGTGLQYPDQSANGEEYFVDVEAYPADRPAVPAGYPDASNTGYTTSLTPSGGITTSSNGQVIENLDISGGVTINHANVIVRNCRVTINDNLGSAIRINSGGTNAYVHHNDVYGGTGSYIGIFISAGTNCTIEYNDISRFENNIFVGGDATIQHNYLHDMFSSIASPHYDGIECNGGSNITIYHNTVINDFTQTSAVMLDNADAGLSNITVDDNVIIGGAYALYCDGHFAGGAVTGITITNNKVAPGFYGSFNFNSTTPTSTGNTNLYSGISI